MTPCARCDPEYRYQQPFLVELCDGCPRAELVVYDTDGNARASAHVEPLDPLEQASVDAARNQAVANLRPLKRT